jgi:hypothetical protein
MIRFVDQQSSDAIMESVSPSRGSATMKTIVEIDLMSLDAPSSPVIFIPNSSVPLLESAFPSIGSAMDRMTVLMEKMNQSSAVGFCLSLLTFSYKLHSFIHFRYSNLSFVVSFVSSFLFSNLFLSHCLMKLEVVLRERRHSETSSRVKEFRRVSQWQK